MWRNTRSLITTLIILLVVWVPLIQARWNRDGTVICYKSWSRYSIQIISDGAGGAIITWDDERAGNNIFRVYAQKVNIEGDVQWTAHGVPICMVSGDEAFPQIATDGDGGAIITWSDERDWDTNWNDVYAQRIDTDGNALWTTDGVPVCTLASFQYYPMITADGAGGAIVTWWDMRDNATNSSDIYAQRLDANGNIQWAVNGEPVCVRTETQFSPQIVSDGSGGAIIAWRDDRSGTIDIFAQRIDAGGNTLWTVDGVPVCTAADEQSAHRLVSDGAGGVIMTWQDKRNGTDWNVYAQRIDTDGNVLWTSDGVAICTAVRDQGQARIIPDGTGGAIITWSDYRVLYDNNIFAQRINANGNILWTTDGVAICTDPAVQRMPVITPDAAGGAIIQWYDNRNGLLNELYAQRIDANGTDQWTADGVAICGGACTGYNNEIITDGAGGAIVTWVSLGWTTIYAQRIEHTGYWGFPPPQIFEISDVPDDQGGFVNLAWYASGLDVLPEQLISHYTLWRAASQAKAALMINGGAFSYTSSSDFIPGKAGSVIRAENLNKIDFFWELVGTVDANGSETYIEAVPTLQDSTATSIGYTYFRIMAHLNDPAIWWVSQHDSGYSVDNLAPLEPQGFSGIQSLSPPGLRLSWDANAEQDLSHYKIHRGDSASFLPEGSNLISTTTYTTYIDTIWPPPDNLFYKLAAADEHGNVGPSALLRPEDIVVGTLLQNFTTFFKEACIEISWSLIEHSENTKWFISRAEHPGKEYQEIRNPEIVRERLTFTFRDDNWKPGTTYGYRVEVLDEEGRRILFETDAISIPSIPLTLYQNYPNPFNPSTTIRYYLPEGSHITLEIYDTSGRRIARLVEKTQAKGPYAVEWTGRDHQGNPVTSGAYYYRLKAGKSIRTRKMILLK